MPETSKQWNQEIKYAGTVHERPSAAGLMIWTNDASGTSRTFPRIFISPSSSGRLSWDIMGVVLIAYDVLSIPLLAFEIPSNSFSTFLDWLTLCFWTLDAIQSFFLGYYDKGILVTDRSQIIKHYLRTWFILDLLIVGPDWFISISTQFDDQNDESDISGMGRLIRAARSVRLLRLLRLLKLRSIIASVQEMIESEHAFTLLGLFKLLLCILVLNHVIACIWYLIGSLSMKGGVYNWLEKAGTNGTDAVYSYTTSLHWSLTQFTPASMDVSAANVYERVFSIFVLLFAIVAFSSIVASITSTMASINNSNTEEMKQFWLLRKYLRQRSVSKDLTGRIFKYLEHQISSQTRLVQEANIKLLPKLSEPLKDELRSSLFRPILMYHGFFKALDSEQPVVIPQLCKSCVRIASLASEDPVFTCDAEARFVYFVKSGAFSYSHKFSMRLCRELTENQWCGEPAIWSHWRHFGDLLAEMPSEVLTVDPKGFVATLAAHARAWFFAKHYAELVIHHLNSCEVSELSDFSPDGDFSQRRSVQESRSKCTSQAIMQVVGEMSSGKRRHLTRLPLGAEGTSGAAGARAAAPRSAEPAASGDCGTSASFTDAEVGAASAAAPSSAPLQPMPEEI